ncbi:MAG TPA: hypothetical protein VIG62_11165 [Blastocatellia bacterium]|jgi:hypothetical protein
MFIGHYAVGLAAKRVAPRASLGALIAAPLLLDLVWPLFILMEWEEVRIEPNFTAFTPLKFIYYPYSHSLMAAIGWAFLFSFVYWGFSRYSAGAFMIWVGVISHWFMDALVHAPDLPIYPGSETRVGFGLWNSVTWTLIVEGLIFAWGLWQYLKTTRARDRIGRFAFWSLVLLIVAAYGANFAGPPPEDETTLALFALAAWITPFWAAWADRHRSPVRAIDTPQPEA